MALTIHYLSCLLNVGTSAVVTLVANIININRNPGQETRKPRRQKEKIASLPWKRMCYVVLPQQSLSASPLRQEAKRGHIKHFQK